LFELLEGYAMGFWSDLWDSMRTWITDWYKSDVLKEHLTSQALAHRKPISQTLLERHAQHPEQYGRNLPVQPTEQELFNAFMFSGVDYRGQAQYAFETLGYGAGISMSVDLAKMFLPPGVSMFLTASVSGNFSAKKASHRFLFIANQGQFTEFTLQQVMRPPVSLPEQGESWRIRSVGRLLDVQERGRREILREQETRWHPVVLSCMLGKWTNMKGGLGVEVGGKFDTTNMFNIGISDVESFGFAIKLTASASASLDGTWVFATDPAPLHTDKSREQMRQWFTDHLKSTTSSQKKEFNHAFEEMHTDINPSCYLSWWLHTKEAGAGLSGGAVATAGTRLASNVGPYNDQTIGPGGTLSLSAKLPSVKWTSKTSSYRLNNPCSDPDIVLSQETKILYKQVGGQLLGLALDLELGCAVAKPNPASGGKTDVVTLGDPQSIFFSTQKVYPGPKTFSNYYDYTEHGGKGKTLVTETVAPPDLDLYKSANFKATLTSKSLKLSLLEGAFKKLEKNWETVNSMAYETGIAFWSKTHHLLLEGSGFVVGQSLTLPGFIKYWNSCEQCRDIFEAEIPTLDRVRQTVLDLIKATLPGEASALPTVENWLGSTETGDLRWNIKTVDNAVKAYWKHMSGPPWNAARNSLPDTLLTRARQNCKSQTSDTQEQKDRRVCGGLIYLVLEESKVRSKLYADILAGIEKWVDSKGGVRSATSNKRFPGVLSLWMSCAHEMEKLDRFASVLDVAKEYLDMRTMEDGLSKSLHVSSANLRTFLCDKGLQGAVKDIVGLMRSDRAQTPGAFLIEASFKLSAGKLMELSQGRGRFKEGGIDLESDFTEAMKKKLEGNFDSSLQYISIRYRKADTKAGNRSFRLGVGIGAAQLGFSLDRVRQAGTEGNFMVSTIWFGQYQSANARGGWPEKTTPMPVILS
jgi:hypothetical protein